MMKDNKIIKLNRLLLINWYGYYNTVINFGDTTLISGDTGVGKSVINDALMYILIHDQKQFNKAGQDKGSRTLNGFVRGLKSIDDNNNITYLRKEGCCSIIAAEFDNFIAGMFFESNATNVNTTYFTIEQNAKLEKIHTIDKDNTMSKAYFKTTPNLIIHEKASKYDNALANLMKIKDYEVFKTMIKRALAYQSNITIETFLKTVLFQENEIDCKDLNKMLESINGVLGELEECQIERKLLEPIVNYSVEYDNKKEQLEIKKCLYLYSKWQAATSTINELRAKIKNREMKISDINNQLTILNNNKRIKDSQLRVLSDNIDEIGGKQLAKLREDLHQQELEKEKEEKRVKRLNDIIDAMENLIVLYDEEDALEFSTLIKNFLYKIENCEYISDETYSQLHFEDKLNELQGIADTQRDELRELDKRYNENKNKLMNLNAGKSVDARIYKFINDFKNYALKFGREKDIRFIEPLADLVTYVDEEWRQILESVIYNEKKTIIVNSEIYDLVSRFQEKYEEKGIKVYDVESMPKYEVLKDSLKEKISAENEYAEKVLTMLLGRIIICTIDNIRTHSYGITKTGLIRKNYQQWALPQTKDITLGKDALKKMKKVIESEIEKITKEKSILRDKNNQIDKNIKIITRLINIPDCLLAKYNVNIIDNAINELKDTIRKYENDSSLIESVEKKKALEKEILNTSKQIEKLISERASCECDNKRDMDNLANIDYDDLESEYKNSNFSDDIKLNAEKDYERRRKNPKDIPNTVKLEIDRDITEIQHYFNDNIREKMKDYNNAFGHHQFGIAETDIEKYKEQYFRIKSETEVKIQNRMNRAKEDAIEMMKTDIFLKLMENIDNAKEFVRQVNIRLKEHIFGNDTYRIKVDRTTNQKFSKIYRAMEAVKENSYLGTSEDSFMNLLIEQDPKSKEAIDEFAKMMMEYNETSKEIKEYLDYRNYLNFDIMYSRNGEKESSMKGKASSDSGGQFQTPYYAILAAGFRTTCSEIGGVNLIIIDEAFNRMGPERIYEMFDYLSETFGFQLIITAPITSAPILKKKSDTVVFVTAGKNVSQVSIMKDNVVLPEEETRVFYGREHKNY